MKCLKGVLLSVLFANAATAQPVAVVSPDNFTADPLFQQYISDEYQLSRALQATMVKMMDSSIPPEVKAAAPALPGCTDEMRKVLGDGVFITPLMSKLQSLSPDERKQFAAFAQFLHSADGGRLIALNHEAMAVSDKPDDNGMPQLASDRDSKLDQIKTLLQNQPQPNELPQALFGLGIYMQGIAEQFANGGGIEEAQKKVFASPACTALQQQMDAYDKAHPQKK
ncbi:hypothetical protein [Novosphingobium terrae]|uniref:hypothetical protein n=1 Tax=Novosphingobium terrae TaxID=2726189 RepID=UPI00197CEF5B|nr:hypothetical protein [Novosphingobium terrae]